MKYYFNTFIQRWKKIGIPISKIFNTFDCNLRLQRTISHHSEKFQSNVSKETINFQNLITLVLNVQTRGNVRDKLFKLGDFNFVVYSVLSDMKAENRLRKLGLEDDVTIVLRQTFTQWSLEHTYKEQQSKDLFVCYFADFSCCAR